MKWWTFVGRLASTLVFTAVALLAVPSAAMAAIPYPYHIIVEEWSGGYPRLTDGVNTQMYIYNMYLPTLTGKVSSIYSYESQFEGFVEIGWFWERGMTRPLLFTSYNDGFVPYERYFYEITLPLNTYKPFAIRRVTSGSGDTWQLLYNQAVIDTRSATWIVYTSSRVGMEKVTPADEGRAIWKLLQYRDWGAGWHYWDGGTGSLGYADNVDGYRFYDDLVSPNYRIYVAP